MSMKNEKNGSRFQYTEHPVDLLRLIDKVIKPCSNGLAPIDGFDISGLITEIESKASKKTPVETESSNDFNTLVVQWLAGGSLNTDDEQLLYAELLLRMAMFKVKSFATPDANMTPTTTSSPCPRLHLPELAPVSQTMDSGATQKLLDESYSASDDSSLSMECEPMSIRIRSDGIMITRSGGVTTIYHPEVQSYIGIGYFDHGWQVITGINDAAYRYSTYASATEGAIRKMKRLIAGRPLRKPK
jgi:hypothetical protein